MMIPRMKAAVILIAGLVVIIYGFSIIPYLLVSNKPAAGPIMPFIEMSLPASAFAVILVLVFLVPRRKSLDKQAVKTAASSESGKTKTIRDMAEYRFKMHSLKSATIAGFLAGSILVGLVLAGDSIMRFPLGTFYSVVGVVMAGLPPISVSAAAIFFGITLHLVMGTTIGAVFGYLTTVIAPFNITGLAKGAGVGILAGFVSFSAFFIPLTRFEVEPSLMGILSSVVPPGTSVSAVYGSLTDIMSSVLAGAIVLHITYGVIMGATTAYLLGFPTPRERRRETDFRTQPTKI